MLRPKPKNGNGVLQFVILRSLRRWISGLRTAFGTLYTTGQSRDLSLSLAARFKMTKLNYLHSEACILRVKGTFFGTRSERMYT